MEIIEYKDHEKLIPFYSKRGIEELTDYPNPPVFSYVVTDGGNFIGAATCSKKDEFYILGVVLGRLKELGAKDVILNAKDTRVFEKNGFVVSDRKNVPETAYNYCVGCEDYGVKCFPKIMKYSIPEIEKKPIKK